MVATTAGFLLYQLFGAPSAPPRPVSTRPAAPALVVQVAGEVREPGVYSLPGTGRVEEAIRLAGGPTEEADIGRVNQAARVSDGQKIVVPRIGAGFHEGTAESGGQAAGNVVGPRSAGERVNLNTASFAELDALPGVGPATAQKILEQRQRSAFHSVDQLVELKLVNAPTFQRLRDLISVD